MENLVFDNSMLVLYKSCPRKYYYRCVEHLCPKIPVSVHILFGQAFHKALDVWYTEHDVKLSVEEFVSEFQAYDGLHETKTLRKGTEAIIKYVEKYKNEPLKVIQVEMGFTIELGKYIYVGRIDAVAEGTGVLEGIYIIDHKTTSKKNSVLVDPNHQIDGYIYGENQISGKPVAGAILNNIVILKNSVTPYRQFTKRSASDIHNWINTTLAWMDRISSDKDFPKNTSACKDFNHLCDYIILCKNDRDEELCRNLQNNFYTIKKWEPFPLEEEEDGNAISRL